MTRLAQSDNLTSAETLKAPLGDSFVPKRDVSQPRADWQDKFDFVEVHIDTPVMNRDKRLGLKKRWQISSHATLSPCSPEQLETVRANMNAGNTPQAFERIDLSLSRSITGPAA